MEEFAFVKTLLTCTVIGTISYDNEYKVKDKFKNQVCTVHVGY